MLGILATGVISRLVDGARGKRRKENTDTRHREDRHETRCARALMDTYTKIVTAWTLCRQLESRTLRTRYPSYATSA